MSSLLRCRTSSLAAAGLFTLSACVGALAEPDGGADEGKSDLPPADGGAGPDGGVSTSGGDGGALTSEGGTNPDASVAGDERIASVWFAQTHVQRSDDPLLELVGNRAALLKVDLVSPTGGAAPQEVSVTMRRGGETRTMELSGPDRLPVEMPSAPGVVEHDHANSFTVMIPSEWVQPGLQLDVRAGSDTRSLSPAVGAPTVVHMTMFDVYYLGEGLGGDYPEGWSQELEAKWPVAELQVQRVPNLVFDTLVIPQRSGVGAARVSSKQEYTDKTGLNFDGEQAAALRWVAALRLAGGQSDLSLYYVNIYGVHAGGQAGGFQGVGNGTSQGVLHHELGHALSLPHWGDNGDYPYKGDMHGVAAPDIYNGTHAGPTWAFDLPSATFIPPVVQPDNVGDRPEGTFKADPMQGGGTGDQEPGFLLRHFSDYSMAQMRNYLQRKVVVYDAAGDRYVRWDSATGGYDDARDSNGVNYPLEHDVDVISVMASTSMADTDVNLVYPPIGPYRGGLIRTFDPTVEADRQLADQIYCPNEGCDYSLRIVQGGVERTFMLRASGSPADDPLQGSSLGTAAVNLRASDGAVTSVQLLSTPDAEQNGLGSGPSVLYSWPEG